MRGRKPSWIACWVSENAPEMIACEAMMVASVANAHQRVMGPSRREQIERVLDRAGVGEKQRALAEIIEHQRGQDDGEPAEADRQAAEMAHIRIHRLAAGDGQEGGPEHRESRCPARHEPGRSTACMRTERRRGCAGARTMPPHAEQADGDEPDQHHRAEDRCR